MQHSLLEIKEKLVKALDKDNNVVDVAGAMEVITVLENTQISKEALEKTRLGKYVNEVRKKTTSELLAKRAKELVRTWRKLIQPQDAVPVNGERSSQVNFGTYPVVSGASWSMFRSGKTIISPAASNHKNLRATSPLTTGSPVSWHCSSTSTSPALGPLLSGSRPGTPSLVGQRASPVLNDGHHPSSTQQLNASGRSRSPHDAEQHGTRWNASPPKLKNEFHKVPPVATAHRGPSTSPGLPADKVVKLSHSSNTELVDRTNAANKRLRKERAGDHGPTSKRLRADVAEGAGTTNGLDSGESSRSPHEHPCETQVPTSDSYPVSKRQHDVVKNSKVRHEKSDSLKEKIASHARTPKVKTTAQLIEELKARNTISVNFTPASPSLPTQDLRPSPFPRRPTSSVLNNDHELTKTKSELLEKFLQATTSSASYGEEPSCSGHNISCASVDPIDEILGRLPPIDREAIDWDEGGGDDDENADASEPKNLCTDDDVDRLATRPWEGMNGKFDHEHNFKEWNEALSCISHNGDLLHILPYVNID